MPVLGVTTLLVLFVAPPRTSVRPVFCPCGYDLRKATSARCPECGLDADERSTTPSVMIRLASWLAAAVVSATGYMLFARWLLTLG